MKVVFVGGWQASVLCEFYRRLSGAEAHWIDPSAPFGAAEEERLASADKLAVQARGGAQAVEGIAPEVERAAFPELALDFLWPFGGQAHALNTRESFFPLGPFPVELGDAWLNRRLNGRERLEAVEAEYLALDVAAMLDLDGYKTLALARQAEIDARCGTDFAGRFEAQFRTQALFANPLTPGPDLLRELANFTFLRLGAPYTLTPDWKPRGHAPELPVHPSVARHFGLEWSEGRRYRLWSEDGVDFGEYSRRYLAYCEGPEMETGLLALAHGHAEVGVKLLEKAVGRPMGRRCDSARRPLTLGYLAASHSDAAAGLLRRAGALEDAALFRIAEAGAAGRWSEAEAAAVELLQQRPDAADVAHFLALVRERRGDSSSQVAALRAALALQPTDAISQSRLTMALANQGDLASAIESAEAEIALQPDNPHPRVFVSSLLERAGEPERARAHRQRAFELVSNKPEYMGLRDELTRQGFDLENAEAG